MLLSLLSSPRFAVYISTMLYKEPVNTGFCGRWLEQVNPLSWSSRRMAIIHYEQFYDSLKGISTWVGNWAWQGTKWWAGHRRGTFDLLLGWFYLAFSEVLVLKKKSQSKKKPASNYCAALHSFISRWYGKCSHLLLMEAECMWAVKFDGSLKDDWLIC